MNPENPAHPHGPRALLKTIRALPLGIWALGFGSMFMDSSSIAPLPDLERIGNRT